MKKLLELLKKLLGNKSSNGTSSGFTLIELLIVIAILGILAGGLLLAIDPAEKLRQGNDTRAINDVSQTAAKIEQYAISTSNGVYPAATGTPADDVPAIIGNPTPPNASYVYTYVVNANNTFILYVDALQSKKYNGVNTRRFLYESAKGKSCFRPNTATTCP